MVFCGRAQAEVEKEINVVTNSILISTIIAILIAAALAIFVALAITNAITHGVGILEKVSEGDLTEEVPDALIRRKDELGVMGKSIEDLRESLIAIITELKNQSTSLYSPSDKLNVTSSEHPSPSVM